MRRRVPLALLALAALAVVPAPAQAGAEILLRDFDLLTLDLLDHWINTTLSGAEARLVRQDADADGNQAVSAQEADAYAQRLRTSQANQTAPLATRDGAAPLTQTALTPHLEGLVGPADSESELRMGLGFRLTFPPAVDGPWHQLERDARHEKPGPVRLRVPSPFVHLQSLGVADPVPSDDGRTLGGRTSNGTALDVQFIHEDQAGAARATLSSGKRQDAVDQTPAPGAVLAVLAGLAALALRRPRAQP